MLCQAWNSFPRHTELEGGHEKIIGKFETQSGKAHLGHEPQLIQVGTSGAFEKPQHIAQMKQCLGRESQTLFDH